MHYSGFLDKHLDGLKNVGDALKMVGVWKCSIAGVSNYIGWLLLLFYFLWSSTIYVNCRCYCTKYNKNASFTDCFFSYSAAAPRWAMASSFLMRFLDHTQRRTTVGRTPLDEWSARRRDLYLSTNNTPCPGGIRTHNLSRRAAADLRLKPHSHWDRLTDC